jgi:cytochrome c biogenesis protein CcmG/thiol:disulfide interchange protein DsbE
MKRLVVLVLLILTVSVSFAQDGEQTQVNTLPSINIRTLDGEPFNTATISNDGKPILISFWALWCKPCKNEMDAYNEVYEEWQEETGVKIYAVSIDDSRSSAKVQPFVNGKAWEMEVLLDPNGDFKRAMNVNMIPHTFLLDGNGNVVYQHTSYYEGLEEEIYELVELVAAGKPIPKH